jgi:two-component system sensor histidine kinase KdpD
MAIMEREGRAAGLELTWVRSDGTTLFVRESARAVRDPGGEILYYEGTVEDISARKRAEEQVARLMEEAAEAEILREVDRLRSELIANVSHEIRTPLGLIEIASSSLLMEDVEFDGETQRQFLQGIRDETDRLKAIVDNLLNLSRLESGRLHLHKQPTNLALLARQVMEGTKLQAPEHCLVAELPGALIARVDPVQVEQVLRNLLSNAVKYSPAGGTIAVRGWEDGAEVTLCVEDEGIGIPDGEQQRIFERFHRVDSTLVHAVSGVGLGLAVCRGIVDAYGGRIWVESAPGEGSRFYVTLPAD